MEVRKLGLNARASCKPVRRQTPARPCGARRSLCRSRRRGTQANADVAGFVPSRSGSGSQVSVLGYAVLMPGHSTTSSRCGAVFLRHSNIRCRCLSWGQKRTLVPSRIMSASPLTSGHSKPNIKRENTPKKPWRLSRFETYAKIGRAPDDTAACYWCATADVCVWPSSAKHRVI